MNDNFQAESPISEYFRIIKRRKWLVVGIATVILAGAVSAALLLPATYQSTATILIEESTVADDLANAGGVNFADQRLQLIQQRVMTTAKLLEVIDRVGLYREVRQTTPANVLAADMRSRIVMKLVGSDAADAKNRQAMASTAFTLSYTGRDPDLTQRVARELVDLYLAENERSQRNRALGTAGFLSGESNRLSGRIKELEVQLADFKSKNAGMLPEEKDFNAQLLDRTQNQLLEFMRQAQAARERQAFLQAQLLTLEPQAPVNSANPELLSPKARLRLLKAQYSTLVSKYGDKHPDVVRLRRQIDAMSGSASGGEPSANLDDLEAQLQIASQKYGDAHPDVVRLKRQIKAVKASLAGNHPAVEAPDNPVYVQTQAQLSAANAEVGMAQAQIASLQGKMADVEARIIKSPEVERAYAALKRDYDAAVTKFSDLQQRESQAELAKNLETEQMGERLSLIEPPPLPTSPISPNRPAIVLVGIVLAVSGAIAAAILIDSFDGRIYGQRRLASVLGRAPLVLIPRIESVYEPAPRRHRFAMVMLSMFVLIGVMIHTGDLGLSTLGEIWSSIMERADTL